MLTVFLNRFRFLSTRKKLIHRYNNALQMLLLKITYMYTGLLTLLTTISLCGQSMWFYNDFLKHTVKLDIDISQMLIVITMNESEMDTLTTCAI